MTPNHTPPPSGGPMTLKRLEAARAIAARVVQLHGADPYLVHFERLDDELADRRRRAGVMDRIAEIAGQPAE